MQRQILLHGKAANIDDIGQLVPLRDLKRQFGPFFAPLRHTVKRKPEGFVKQLGEPGCKSPVFCDNADLIPLKGIAKQQHAMSFRPGTALPLQRRTAQLRFGFAGK